MFRRHVRSQGSSKLNDGAETMSRKKKGRASKTSIPPRKSRMPPAISDDEMESDGVDVPDSIPAKAKIPSTAQEEDEDEEDGDEEADEYRVEKILAHEFNDEGTLFYQIKWLGYDSKKDLTWEPIENLAGAHEILEEYHAQMGGEPVYDPAPKKKSGKGGKQAGKKRSASAAFTTDSPAVETSSKKRGRKSMNDATNGTSAAGEKKLPEGSWEDKVFRVGSILEETADPLPGTKASSKAKGGTSVLLGLLEWFDGRKTQHPLTVLRVKCPQKLLDYYEGHLKFNEKVIEEDEDQEESD